MRSICLAVLVHRRHREIAHAPCCRGSPASFASTARARIQLARGRIAVQPGNTAQAGRELTRLDAQDFPTRAHALGGRRRVVVNGGDDARARRGHARRGRRCRCRPLRRNCIQIAVDIGRNDGEMRFAQASHHLTHDGSRACGRVDRALDLGPQLVAHRGPLTPPNAGSQYWSRMVDQMNSKDSILSRFCCAVSGGWACAVAIDTHASAQAMISERLNLRFYPSGGRRRAEMLSF